MKVGVYAVYDSAPEVFLNPVYCRSDEEAARAFSDQVLHPESNFGKNPEFFTLFKIGNFDDSTGTIDGHGKITVISAQKIIDDSRKIKAGELVEFDNSLTAGGTA